MYCTINQGKWYHYEQRKNHETFHKILDIYNNNTNNFDLTFNFKSSGMAKILKKNDENLFVSKKIIIRQFTFKNLIRKIIRSFN